MFLSAPTVATWTLSSLLVLALIAVKYLGIAVPAVGDLIGGNLFEVLLLAYGILWAGNVFRGL
jgi:hypothetical protein